MKNMYREKKKLRGGTGVLPKALFVIMALLGSVLVWVIKSMNVDPLITILVPVSFIVIYCLLAWQTALFYIREDQIGDNAYYLGFLFTLSSLAYALWRFQVNQGTHGSDPADIIGSFGVALWSTIVGIAFRVFFSQIRQDPQDIEKEARAKIAQAASLLAGDLYQASVTFNAYTRSLQQSVDEAFQQVRERSTKTISLFEDLNKKIEKTETPDSIINRKIDGLFSNLESATNKLNSLADAQTQSVERLIGSSTEYMQGIKSLNSQIEIMKGNVSAVGSSAQSIQKIEDLLSGLQGALARLSEGFSDLNNKQAQAVQGIAQHADALDRQLERSRKYTEETHESLASMTKTLAKKLQ